MPTTYTLIGDPDNKFEIVNNQLRLRSVLLNGASATAVVRQNKDGVVTDFPFVVDKVNRIRVQNKISDGRPAPIPQDFYDGAAAQASDANLHPHMGPYSHVAVKNGNWSDPTLWDTGTVPGNGAIVNVSTFDVTYDVESDALIYGIHVGGTGIWRWPTNIDVRLRIRTMMNHGTELGGDYFNPITESPTLGKKRIEVIFHRMGVNPGTTVELGWNNMGPVRRYSTPKAAQLTSANMSIAVGATSATLVNAEGANWRKGDKLLWLATSYAGTVSTDPWYDGPTSFWQSEEMPGLSSGAVGRFKQESNNAGYMQSHDQVVTVNTFDPATGVLTWDEPLAQAREGATETSVRGKVLTVMPVVALLSYPMRFRGATLNNPADAAVDSTANLRNLQYRAHMMAMHNDDIDIRGIEILDMGRTDVDPSLSGPDGFIRFSQQTGGTQITNLMNVPGRYPIHLHWTGPYLGRKAPILKNVSIWSSANEQFTPGWACTVHHSRALLEDITCYRFRGAGFVSEIATEIGQATRCIAAWGRGDGFNLGLEGRAEIWLNHNGHAGHGWDSQSRAMVFNDCINTSCTRGFHWGVGRLLPFPARVVSGVDLRLRHPLVQGEDTATDGPITTYSDNYGRSQPQIPVGHNNMSWGCRTHLSIVNRTPNRQDNTPMAWFECHALRCSAAVAYGPYVNTYYLYDCLFIGTGPGTAISYFTVNWRQMVVNCVFKDFAAEFYDEGLRMNHDGYFVDNKRIGGDGSFRVNGQNYITMPNDIVTYDWYNAMGDTLIDPNNPKRAIPRVFKNNVTADFPLPYPLAPYGLKLANGNPLVLFGDAPYLTQISGPHTFVAGNQRNQFDLVAVIRDSAGDRRLGDFQSAESFPNAYGPKTGYKSSKMTGEQAVIRNGCFQVGGSWFTRLRFPEADRLTGKIYNLYSNNIALTGFSPAFLAEHTIDPAATFDDVDFLPEVIGPPVQIKPDTTAPVIVTAPSQVVSESSPLLVRLQSNEIHPKYTLSGPDASHFEIYQGVWLRFAGNVLKDFEIPDDANLDNIYTFTLRATDPAGNFSEQVMNVGLNNFPEGVSSFEDDFTGVDGPLEDRAGWTRVNGVAGSLAVRSNKLAIVTSTTATVYTSPDIGSPSQRLTVVTSQASEAFIMARYSDPLNWVGIRFHWSSSMQLHQCVNGVTSQLGEWGNGGLNQTNVFELVGNKITYKRGGTTIPIFSGGTDTIALNPTGTRAAVRASNYNVNPWIDNFKIEAI